MTNLTFHIGLHKTATTWMQHVFYTQHPQIHNIVNSTVPWEDELIYLLIKSPEMKFDADHWRYLLEQRLNRLSISKEESVLVSAERLSGHPANGGIDRFRTARRIHKVAPHAKVLCVFRNQTSMIPSLYRTMVNEGYTGSIEELLVDKSWKTVGANPAFFEYDLLAREYLSLFGKEQCLLLCYEHMRQDPNDFLKRICRFLEIKTQIPDRQFIQQTVNAGFPKHRLGLFRCLNAYRRTEFNPHLPVSVPNALFQNLVKVYRRVKQPKTFITEDQMNTIRSMYADSNLRLKALLDDTMAGYVASYVS